MVKEEAELLVRNTEARLRAPMSRDEFVAIGQELCGTEAAGHNAWPHRFAVKLNTSVSSIGNWRSGRRPIQGHVALAARLLLRHERYVLYRKESRDHSAKLAKGP